jgi:hypothetical protein
MRDAVCGWPHRVRPVAHPLTWLCVGAHPGGHADKWDAPPPSGDSHLCAACSLTRTDPPGQRTTDKILNHAVRWLLVAVLCSQPAHGTFSGARTDRAWLHSAITYCTVSGDGSALPPSVINWNCEYCRRDIVSGFRVVTTISNAATDTQGYFGVDTTLRECTVAFRGTEKTFDDIILTDLLGIKSTAPEFGRPAIRVHRAFYSDYRSVADALVSAVGIAEQGGACDAYLFTGHSLGGAIATLAAVDIARRDTVLMRRVAQVRSPCASPTHTIQPTHLPY